MKKKGAEVEEVSAEADAESAAKCYAAPMAARTYPQIFIGDHHVGGCDDLFALDAAGELDPLLNG
ncbi:MAG: glutaredoxin 3 [Parvularculaceae bacterium]